MVTTLRNIQKQARLKHKDIALAFKCGTSKAALIIAGAYVNMSDEEIALLAQTLGITFERCWIVMVDTHNERMGNLPGTPYMRHSERMAEAQRVLGTTVEEPRSLGEVEGSIVVEMPLLPSPKGEQRG